MADEELLEFDVAPDGTVRAVQSGPAVALAMSVGPIEAIDRVGDVYYDKEAGGWRIGIDPRLAPGPDDVFPPERREEALAREREVVRAALFGAAAAGPPRIVANSP